MFVPMNHREKYVHDVKQAIRDGITITGDILKNPVYLQKLRDEVEAEKKGIQDAIK